MHKRRASTCLSSSYIAFLLLWTLCCHVGVAQAESSSSDSTAISNTTLASDNGSDDYNDETDSGNLLHPLAVCVGLFLLGLVLATIIIESRRACMARSQYRDYRERVEESLEHHHFSKRDPSVIVPLGGGPHPFQFRGRYVDCSFYQSRVSPETNRACCHRSRLRRNVGDQEVPMEGVFTIVDEHNQGNDKMVESSDEESGIHVETTGSEDQYDIDNGERYLSIEGHGSSTYGPFEITSGRLCPYSGRWYLLIEDRPSVLNCCVRRKLMMSGFLYTPSDDTDDDNECGEGKCPGSLHFSGNWRATNGASGQAALITAWPEGRQPPPGLDKTENKTEGNSWSSVYDA